MSQLTDAIKARNTEKALDLIRGTSFASRAYKRAFDRLYGNLLEAPEITKKREHMRRQGNTFTPYKGKRPGYDPMQLAASVGLTDVVRALLEAGVAVQRTPPEDYSNLDYFAIKHHSTPPLNLALESGHDETAMVLIEAGANVNAYSYTNLTYFGVPFDERPFYVDCGCSYAATPLYLAVTGCCSLLTMRALVERGATVNDSIKGARAYRPVDDQSGFRYLPYMGSILINAVAHLDDTRIDVVEFLLQHGAELNKYIFYKYDRENEAYTHEHESNFDFMAHSDAYSPGTYNSAVTMAIRGGKDAIARLLLQNGAQIIAQDHLLPKHVLEDIEWCRKGLPRPILERAEQIARALHQHVHARPQPVMAFRSLVQNNVDTKPVIQQELDKLVQLDPTMRDHEFYETLLCPINKTLMVEPEMVWESGNTYEKSAIKKWFETHNTDPLSGRQLSSTATRSNGAVKRIILEELQKLYTAAEARKNPGYCAPELAWPR